MTGHDVELSQCPDFNGSVNVFHAASAYYYAPSDLCGTGGMVRQVIHSTPSWRKGPARYNCVLVENDPTVPGLKGMYIGQVILFFSFKFRGTDNYPCALVKWFTRIDENPCPVTGLWMVQPEKDDNGDRVISVIHVDSIFHGVHLIPVYGRDFTDKELHFSHSLDAFKTYYVSKYSDYHTFQLLHSMK